MRPLRLVSLVSLLSTIVLAQSTSVISQPLNPKGAVPSGLSQPDPASQAKIRESYGKLPLSFEANHGQADGRVKFLSRTGGYTLFLTGDEAVLTMSGKRAKDAAPKGASGFRESARRGKPRLYGNTGGVLRMKLRNANAAARITGLDELAGTSNYFIGNDPAKWRTDVSTYAKVKYEGIYSGIDLVYYGNQRQLEYDFIVAPGADPRRIAFDVSGAKRIRRDAQGELVFKVGEDEIRWHRPVVYQEKDGARQEIAAHYAITDTNRVGFELAKYDADRPLYIDPLIYSTYLGGSNADYGFGIAVDSAGNAYVTGTTDSTDFPTMNPLQPANGGYNAFVTKINPAGSALVYSTYLGGNSNDEGQGIAVDSAGNAYVTGLTNSTDFPVTPGAFQTTLAGDSDAFATKINPSGSALVYSTYLGGSGNDYGQGIAADSAGNAYVTGLTGSTDFPVTLGAFQTTLAGDADAFVTKINPTGSALVYSTYLGGTGIAYGDAIAVDSAGNAYVTGNTDSTNFPITPGALQTVCNGGSGCAKYGDAFVTEISPKGTALVYSTYLGGSSYEYGYGIAVDGAGNTYVTGATFSTDFPTESPLQPTYGGNGDAFVSKINATGSALVYSTYLGGRRNDYGYGIAVDRGGNAYVTGNTFSMNFPITGGALQKVCNGGTYCARYGDAFVSKLNPSGSALVASTYLGGSLGDWGRGIAVDGSGNAYVTGYTGSTDFPTLNPLQPANGGGGFDAFVTKIHVMAVTTTVLTSSPNPSTYGQAVTFTAVVGSNVGPPPDGETVSFMKGTTLLGTGALSGGSASFTTSALPVGTNSIKAVYGGDSNFLGSTSKAVSQVVNKATTTTTLVSSLNPSNFGQAVTFTASVTPQFGVKVSGTVTFYDGTTALKTMSLGGGLAKFKTSTLTSGMHSITATYNGSVGFDGSSAALTQTVN
jgi:hypothetical protein